LAKTRSARIAEEPEDDIEAAMFVLEKALREIGGDDFSVRRDEQISKKGSNR
jgi:hypothetical protein